MSARPIDLSRRRFVAGTGALVMSFAMSPAMSQSKGEGTGEAATVKPVAPQLPGSLKVQPLLDGWIRIDADNRITVFTGKAELGQGIKTALTQVAAEELVVPMAAITLVTADTGRTANEGYTAGSHSMQDSGTAIRNAAAQVRALLLQLAADKWSVPVDGLRADNGRITNAAGQSASYGELIGTQTLHVSAQPKSTFRRTSERVVIGKPMARVDIPGKVTGGVAYVQDLRLPGMVHGRVVRPSGPSAQLVKLDTASTERIPGVLKVVRDGRFVGVVATKEFTAVTAMRTLGANAAWSEQSTLPAMGALWQGVIAAPSQDYLILDRTNGVNAPVTGAPSVIPPAPDPVAAAAAAASTAASGPNATVPTPAALRTLTATYRKPYQSHGSIGPSCAVAQLVDGQYTVWTHTQGVYPQRAALAELLGVPLDKVRCIHMEGSGCYGHNGADDVAADAALLARALPGKPVRVQWMREDEHGWEPLGPPMVNTARASLDSAGKIVDWQFEVWSQTHNSRPGGAGDLLAGQHIEAAFKPTPPKPIPQPEGGGDRNSIPLYALPTARVVHHFQPDMPLRVSALRSLGAYHNVFAIESFMDELAVSARIDPVEFRLRHMADSRARDVIQLAADRFGWNTFQRRTGRGRGFAFARYKNLGAYAAMAMEIEVSRDTGALHILRVVAATDSGEAVNPDGIRNQIEGGIVQSASWTTAEEVRFDGTRVTSRDWAAYPILRFPQIPDRIDVHIIDRPGSPFLGTGEATQGPTAACIANAVADATGARLRDLPISRSRVRAAIEV